MTQTHPGRKRRWLTGQNPRCRRHGVLCGGIRRDFEKHVLMDGGKVNSKTKVNKEVVILANWHQSIDKKPVREYFEKSSRIVPERVYFLSEILT